MALVMIAVGIAGNKDFLQEHLTRASSAICSICSNESSGESMLLVVVPRCAIIIGVVVSIIALILGIVLHRLILPGLDLLHRRTCTNYHNNWKFRSNPHVRPIKRDFDAGEVEQWNLHVTADGRQRWRFGGSETESAHDLASLADNTTKKSGVTGGKKKAKTRPFVESYHLGQYSKATSATPEKPKPRKNYKEALNDGADFLCKLQSEESGHWSNDYSGPLFLLPGAVITTHICYDGRFELMFPKNGDAERKELIRYIVNLQNTDGGFGVHTEGHSTMMGTVLNYVAMRLLGDPKNSEVATAARNWIRSKGGAQSAPTWAKVWLAVCNLYSWDGINPVPPEMWLLPDWLPISMGRVWCHSRIVTLPFGWLYGKRFVARDCAIYAELRKEMYVADYNKINWSKQRDNIFKDDIYVPHSMIYTVANYALRLWEWLPFKDSPFSSIRSRAMTLCMKHMVYDDEVTNYICLGPVNKCLNMLICWHEEGRASPRFEKHVERLEDYFWVGPEGMRMNGYNGSQLWDTSFALQALWAGEQQDRHSETFKLGHKYIDVAQVRDDPPEREKYYHNRTKGCWNFSTRAQQWQVSDCTAEGLRVVLMARNDHTLKNTGIDIPTFPTQRIYDGVDELLHLRVAGDYVDGGWASYEPPRGPHYLESLNCADVFKDVMIDYSYSECSSSCVHTLCLFRQQFPKYRRKEIDIAIREAVQVVKNKQRPDGSWYGSWAVCFTYAAWLTTEALHLAGESPHSKTFAKCAEFLLSKQRQDGGWSEGINSCIKRVYTEVEDEDETKKSQVVCTCWAVMALIVAGNFGEKYAEQITFGVKFIMSKQLADGDWAQERVTGVFNGACGINYPGYKNSMTVWALGKYHQMMQKLDKKDN